MSKGYTFSETYETWTIDDYIRAGDDGPWYQVVPKEKADKLAEALEPLADGWIIGSDDRAKAKEALKEYRGEDEEKSR